MPTKPNSKSGTWTFRNTTSSLKGQSTGSRSQNFQSTKEIRRKNTWPRPTDNRLNKVEIHPHIVSHKYQPNGLLDSHQKQFHNSPSLTSNYTVVRSSSATRLTAGQPTNNKKHDSPHDRVAKHKQRCQVQILYIYICIKSYAIVR